MSKNERKKYEHIYKAQKVNKGPKIYFILSAYMAKRQTVMQICNLHDCFFYTLITGTQKPQRAPSEVGASAAPGSLPPIGKFACASVRTFACGGGDGLI